MVQERLRRALEDAVAISGGLGAVAYVGKADEEELFFDAVGFRQTEPERHPAEKDTIYDLASVTKAVATTTAIMKLHEAGDLDLDAPVHEYVPVPAFAAFTARHLLTHTAGLPSGHPYYLDASTVDEMLQRYAAESLEWQPGSRYRYSDAGFLLLGRVVELVAGDSLDAFCTRHIFAPLAMNHTRFNPPAEWATRCAATERCAWRNEIVLGHVHDENAYAVGGVAGHAGLFSTAEDLARFCRAMLTGRLFPASVLDAMTPLGQLACFPWQGLGWRLDPWASDFAGFLPSRRAFGHAGWTGTSLWLDRDTGLFAILLANTCHPSRHGRNNPLFRRTFYTAVAEACYPPRRNVHTGLDRLLYEDFGPLRSRRVALLTHQAAVDQFGRSILDVFALAPDVHLRIVYTPEHGLHGQAEAGAAVSSEEGALSIVSLYGRRAAPTPEELADIDFFVIDLRDIGARFYTYAGTMKACLRACARAKKPVLVLDRPNPCGGEILEGPLAERGESMVCWGTVPVRHGMTLGEIALHFQQTDLAGTDLNLRIFEVDNWNRPLLFAECALPWVPPSPNIPLAQTALLYVGTCLFEGTNLSEGRGTPFPFHMTGAPWLDPARVIEAIAPEEATGFRLRPNRFIPKSIAGKATDPKFRDQVCHGIRIRVMNPRHARPFTLAIAIIQAVRRIHPTHFEFGPTFDILAGSKSLRERIEAGESASAIAAAAESGLRAFDSARPRLYA